tara:strand:+ start:308 stop:988 length:681 start_codon:yes stop_codon:yes gene_type:complete
VHRGFCFSEISTSIASLGFLTSRHAKQACENAQQAAEPPRHHLLLAPNARFVDPQHIPALRPRTGPALPLPRFLGAASRKRKRAPRALGHDADDAHDPTPGLLETLLPAPRLSSVRAACAKFGDERDAHEFAVVLGLVQAVKRVTEAAFQLLRVCVAGEAGWAEGLLELHGKTERQPPPELCPQLGAVLVPLVFLEVVYDAFAEGPFFCVAGGMQEHRVRALPWPR